MLNPVISLFSGTLTTAGAQTGVDISGLTGDLTLRLVIDSFSAASGTPAAIINLEDTVNAFSALLMQKNLANIQGTIVAGAPETFTFRVPKEILNLRNGTASAQARINVVLLGGTSPSLSFRAWFE